MIRVYPPVPRADADALVEFRGVPNRAVQWSVSEGTIAPLGLTTDRAGLAYARYTPPRPEGWQRPRYAYSPAGPARTIPITVVNGGAEQGMDGWNPGSFTSYENSFLDPFEGTRWFRSNTAGNPATQDIDLRSAAADIDAGNGLLRVEWQGGGYRYGDDGGSIDLAILGSQGEVTASRYRIPRAYGRKWTPQWNQIQIPPGARVGRLIMTGAGNNAYIDAINAEVVAGRAWPLPLENADAEDSTSLRGWTAQVGEWARQTDYSSMSGSRKFGPASGQNDSSTTLVLAQRVQLDGNVPRSSIETGLVDVVARAAQDGDGDDPGGIGIRAYNGPEIIAETRTPLIIPPLDYEWIERVARLRLPPTTTAVEFLLLSRFENGSNTNSYFDALELEAEQVTQAAGVRQVSGSQTAPLAPANLVTVEATYRA